MSSGRNETSSNFLKSKMFEWIILGILIGSLFISGHLLLALLVGGGYAAINLIKRNSKDPNSLSSKIGDELISKSIANAIRKGNAEHRIVNGVERVKQSPATKMKHKALGRLFNKDLSDLEQHIAELSVKQGYSPKVVDSRLHAVKDAITTNPKKRVNTNYNNQEEFGEQGYNNQQNYNDYYNQQNYGANYNQRDLQYNNFHELYLDEYNQMRYRSRDGRINQVVNPYDYIGYEFEYYNGDIYEIVGNKNKIDYRRKVYTPNSQDYYPQDNYYNNNNYNNNNYNNQVNDEYGYYPDTNSDYLMNKDIPKTYSIYNIQVPESERAKYGNGRRKDNDVIYEDDILQEGLQHNTRKITDFTTVMKANGFRKNVRPMQETTFEDNKVEEENNEESTNNDRYIDIVRNLFRRDIESINCYNMLPYNNVIKLKELFNKAIEDKSNGNRTNISINYPKYPVKYFNVIKKEYSNIIGNKIVEVESLFEDRLRYRELILNEFNTSIELMEQLDYKEIKNLSSKITSVENRIILILLSEEVLSKLGDGEVKTETPIRKEVPISTPTESKPKNNIENTEIKSQTNLRKRATYTNLDINSSKVVGFDLSNKEGNNKDKYIEDVNSIFEKDMNKQFMNKIIPINTLDDFENAVHYYRSNPTKFEREIKGVTLGLPSGINYFLKNYKNEIDGVNGHKVVSLLQERVNVYKEVLNDFKKYTIEGNGLLKDFERSYNSYKSTLDIEQKINKILLNDEILNRFN